MLNPFAFRPWQVTLWTTVTYLALLIPLIIINETVPSVPDSHAIPDGLSLEAAWQDLAILTQGYHSYNSHKNDEVRDWLLFKIQKILDGNAADWTTETSQGGGSENASYVSVRSKSSGGPRTARLPVSITHNEASRAVTVFNDLMSNLTFTFNGSPSGPTRQTAAYFEGTNVYVYIRGSEDPAGRWWDDPEALKPSHLVGDGASFGCVLVNAHYDSVSTAYGATDDGVGVVTILQLLNYFTYPGRQPKHGIILLLNNGEEDYLYGARAFGSSPLLPAIKTFLNLEGAGAGGKALLFRSTDQEVTASYAKSTNPWGTVIASDSFGLGVIKSQTDYVVFNGVYGARGLDLAFYKPRARYHTAEDDLRHTSQRSVWHMLQAAVATVEDLAGRELDKETADGGDGVWFDLFGKAFVLFNLRGMFAWSLTLLIATPLVLVAVLYLAARQHKLYLFSRTSGKSSDGLETVKTGGLKGLSRFFFVSIVAVTLVIGSALLVRKFNPMIVHSSQYSVWAMMIALFYTTFWALMRVADTARPSALHRAYIHVWLFAVGWLLLVAVTVFEDRFTIASGYAFVFWHSAVFLATLMTILDLFALPKMDSTNRQDDVVDNHDNDEDVSDALIAPSPTEAGSLHPQYDEDEEEPSESSPLVRNKATTRGTTFGATYRKPFAAMRRASTSAVKRVSNATSGSEAYDGEQAWSKSLPTWTWLPQFLLLGPFTVVLAAQTGMVLVDAVRQGSTDGGNPLLPYLMIAIFSTFLITPLTPFMHRIKAQVPLFLMLVFIGTLIYNLTAFPFSSQNKYKAFWQQTIDLDTGESTVIIGGIEKYIKPIIAELPSAVGKEVICGRESSRIGPTDCVYDGRDVLPNLSGDLVPGIPPQTQFKDLINIEITRKNQSGIASMKIEAKNTKACVIRFKSPITSFQFRGGSPWDDRFGPVPEGGIRSINLWRRDWNKTWVVDVAWETGKSATIESQHRLGYEVVNAPGLEGNVTCSWSDINTPGVIPAMDEVLAYAPTWAAITKYSVGLVDGSKRFQV